MAKVTKKSLLEKLNAAPEVTATMIGGNALEDWPAMVEKIQAEYEDAEIEGDKITFAGNRFILKPKFTRVRNGQFVSKSTSYTFTWDDMESGGLVTALKVSEDGTALELTMANNAIISYAPAS